MEPTCSGRYHGYEMRIFVRAPAFGESDFSAIYEIQSPGHRYRGAILSKPTATAGKAELMAVKAAMKLIDTIR